MYIEKHGANPEELIHAELMSCEESGPEDEEAESMLAWKARIATVLGLGDNIPESLLVKMKMFESAIPQWRSQEVSKPCFVEHDQY